MQAAFTTSFVSSLGGAVPGGSSSERERAFAAVNKGGEAKIISLFSKGAGPELEGCSIPYLFMVRN